MRLLKLHPADDRHDGDPLPFPINAVRQIMSHRADRSARDHEALDSIENAEQALQRVDRALKRTKEEVDRTFSPFRTAGGDGDRAA